MAVTQYQCTTCKRTRDISDNERGITVTTKCTITHGCRGTLTVAKRLPFTNRESGTAADGGVVDWQQRNILHDHTQKIAADKWRIAHTLNVPFVVDVVVRDAAGERELQYDQYEVSIDTQNLVTLTFNAPVRGTAQLIARNGSKRKVYDAVDEDEIVQVSQGGRIILFDATSGLTAGTATYGVELITPDGTVYDGSQLVSTDGTGRTSWNVTGVLHNDITEMKTFTLAVASIFIVPAIGMIPDGSRLNIINVYGRPLKRHEILIGMVQDTTKMSPFNRTKTRFVDASYLKNGIVIRHGEAFVYESDTELAVPPLRILSDL